MNAERPQRADNHSTTSLASLFRAHVHIEPDPPDSAYQQRYAADMIDGFRVLSLIVLTTMSAWLIAYIVQTDAVTIGSNEAFSVAACVLLAVAGALGLLASKSIRSPATALLATAALLTASTAVISFDRLKEVARDERFTPSLLPIIVLILVLSAAVLPLRPSRTLGLGGLLLATCGLTAAIVNAPIRGHILDFVSAASGVLVAVVVAARSTSQRIRVHHAHVSSIEAERQAERARERALLAESAITMEHLAASLSHELNTPIGALKSATETLTRGMQKHASFPSGSRMPQMVDELSRAIRESTGRLNEIVARIQRFANLDRSAVRLVDINQLVQDAVALMNPPSVNQTRVKLNLEPLPMIWCRPHGLSAAIASVLNAVLDSNSQVSVGTCSEGNSVSVTLAWPVASCDLEDKSTPGFTVVDGRIRASGWDLFAARQFVNETGGALTLHRLENGDQVVTICLPANGVLAGEALKRAHGAA